MRGLLIKRSLRWSDRGLERRGVVKRKSRGARRGVKKSCREERDREPGFADAEPG